MLQRWGTGRGQTTDDAVQSETHNRHTELKYTFTDKTIRQRTSEETFLGLVSSGTLLHLPAAWTARNRQWEHRQSFSLISYIIKHLGLFEAG